MRTWKAPQWLTDQEGRRFELMENGKPAPLFAGVRNYTGSPPFVELRWFSEGPEYEKGLFRLTIRNRDEKTELLLDKEEVLRWLRYA